MAIHKVRVHSFTIEAAVVHLDNAAAAIMTNWLHHSHVVMASLMLISPHHPKSIKLAWADSA